MWIPSCYDSDLFTPINWFIGDLLLWTSSSYAWPQFTIPRSVPNTYLRALLIWQDYTSKYWFVYLLSIISPSAFSIVLWDTFPNTWLPSTKDLYKEWSHQPLFKTERFGSQFEGWIFQLPETRWFRGHKRRGAWWRSNSD